MKLISVRVQYKQGQYQGTSIQAFFQSKRSKLAFLTQKNFPLKFSEPVVTILFVLLFGLQFLIQGTMNKKVENGQYKLL